MRTVPSESILDIELSVLELVATGITHRQIAVALGLSERSVRRRIIDVSAKLGVASPIEAVVAAVRRGLI